MYEKLHEKSDFIFEADVEFMTFSQTRPQLFCQSVIKNTVYEQINCGSCWKCWKITNSESEFFFEPSLSANNNFVRLQIVWELYYSKSTNTSESI